MSTPTSDQSISNAAPASQVRESDILQLSSSLEPLEIIKELKRDFLAAQTTSCQGHIRDQKRSAIVDRGLRFLNGQRQAGQWKILRREFGLVVAVLLQGMPFTSWFLDDTQRGEQFFLYAERDFHPSDHRSRRAWSARTRGEVARWEVTEATGRAFPGFTLRDPWCSAPASPLVVVGPHDEDEEEGGSEKQNSSCAQPISSYRP